MRFLPTIVLTILANIAFGQRVELPIITKQELRHNNYSLDSTAHAIVLIEKGSTRIQKSDADRSLMVFHDYAARIKIMDKEGYDEANFTIPLYTFGSDTEYLVDLKATTHHLDEQGQIVSTPLKRKDIFTEKVSDYLSLTKFTAPNVQPGAIIEVSYGLVSPNIFKFRSWDFQSSIPKLWSEYHVLIPAIFKYNVTLRGALKLTNTLSNIHRECLNINGAKTDCSDITYSMANIPAFLKEDYMLSAKNYISAIHFELEESTSSRGVVTKYTKNWADVDRELMTDKAFGGQLKEDDFFKSVLPPQLLALTDPTEKAAAIYSFIQDNIKWNKYYGKYTDLGVKKSFENKSGSCAEINLALTTALQSAGLEAYPVLVSTRDNIIPNNLHPVISEFNYVLSALKLADKTILLDATEPLLPFGSLPLRAVNDRGRIIYSKKSSEWISLLNPDRAQTSYIFAGKLDQSGKLIGQLTVDYGGHDAFQKRKEIIAYPTQEEYQEKLDERLTNIDLKDLTISNLEIPSMMLTENSQVEVAVTDKLSKGNFSFNPIFINRITKNPFNLDDRTYPVDLGSARTERHVIKIEIPEGVKLTSAPKNMNITIPEQGARYSYRTSFEDNILTVNQQLLLNKATYSTDEYFYLKELFSRAIQQLQIDYIFTYQ